MSNDERKDHIHKLVVACHNKISNILDYIERREEEEDAELDRMLIDFDEDFSKLVDSWSVFYRAP